MCRHNPSGQNIDEVMKEAENKHAERSLEFGLRHLSGLKGKDTASELEKFLIGSIVMVYHTGTRDWSGPFRHNDLSGE